MARAPCQYIYLHGNTGTDVDLHHDIATLEKRTGNAPKAGHTCRGHELHMRKSRDGLYGHDMVEWRAS